MLKDHSMLYWKIKADLASKKLKLLTLTGRYNDKPSQFELSVVNELFKILTEFKPKCS